MSKNRHDIKRKIVSNRLQFYINYANLLFLFLLTNLRKNGVFNLFKIQILQKKLFHKKREIKSGKRNKTVLSCFLGITQESKKVPMHNKTKSWFSYTLYTIKQTSIFVQLQKVPQYLIQKGILCLVRELVLH